MVAPPANVYPPTGRIVNIGRELVTATAAPATVTIPVAQIDPDDKYTMLMDASLRGSRVRNYGMTQGPVWTEHKFPESMLFGDTIGHVLFNALGDYTSTGTAASPNSTLSGGVSAGATSITVTSGTGFLANQWIQVDIGNLAEIVQILSVSTNVLTLTTNTPLRFSHLTGVAVTNTTAAYTHVFSNLNPGGTTGNLSAQPPAHSIIDRTYVPGTGNFNSVLYTYGCFSQVKLHGKASAWMTWEGTALSNSHAYPSALPTVAPSAVKGWPAWRSTTTIGGSQRFEIVDWTCTLNVEVEPIPTADGVQAPYAFIRGMLDGQWTISYNPAIDESALLHLINNDQPTLAWSVSNGGSGASLVQMSIAAQLAGFKSAPIKVNKTSFGYEASGELLSNTTNAGNSAGYSPLQITLVNAVPSY